MNHIGKNIRCTVFGESHNHLIGVVIDGLPAGIQLNFDHINHELQKRRPKEDISTPRIETDPFEIVSGYFNHYTTGSALTILVKNLNTKSEDYLATDFIPRPGHADYPAYIKYNGYHDRRGGGMFSGRLTVLLVIVGAIIKDLLTPKGIIIASHIRQIGSTRDRLFAPLGEEIRTLEQLNHSDFPVLDATIKETMKEEIRNAKLANDSIGGSIETLIQGVDPGIGEPLFRSVESTFSQYLFSIPAIKGVSFGDGFDFQSQRGSFSTDGYTFENNEVKTIANHNGGVLGGITTGMPIRIQTVFKPTSSIGFTQQSVNLKTNQPIELALQGRHDPSIVHRGIHVVNAVCYIALLDLLLDVFPKSWLLS